MPPIGEESTLVLAQRYRLGERVGAGSMGAVWRATDELLGRTVAVKQLLLQPGAPGYDTQGQAYDEARQRILREGRLAARLQHPHAIAVFDVVLHDDAPWLVMEYLPSRTLGALLATEGPLDPRHVARIGRQIADGLSAAHAAGIVHRDIKPGNVLIGADGIVKITDFGVSRAADDVQLTRTGLIAGTPAYLAPETARGLNPTPASDVFALGSTLYTAVEGEPPFGLDDNAYALLYKVGAGAIRPPEHAGPLTEALLRMLRTDPAERPTATGARDELAAVAEGRQLPPPPSRSRRAPSVRRSGSSRRARRLAATRVDLDPVRPVDVAGPSPLAGPIPLVGPVLPVPLSTPQPTPQPTPLSTPLPTQPLATSSGASDVTPSGAGRPGVGSSNADGSADGVARVDGSPDGVSGTAVSGVAGSDSVGSGDAGVDTAAWSVEGPDTAAWSATEGPDTAAWSATEGPDTAAWSATDTDGWGADRAGWPDERAGAGAAGGTGSDGAGIGSAGFGSAGFGSAGFGSAGFGSAAADADPPGSSAALLSGGQPATSALPAWQQPHRPRRWFDLRRRGPSLWALVALVVLVVAATATLAELRRDNSSGPTGGTSAAAPSTPPKAPASPVEIRPDGPPTAADLESFVRGYYALLPAQPAAAWQMLGDQARGESDGYQSYLNFYNGLDSVGFAEAPTAVDDRTVRATLRFATKGGAESVERYQFTVVLGPDGKLVMSSFTKG